MEYTDEMRSSDFHWFVENYDELFKQYGVKFLVVQCKKIIGAYDDVWEAINNTLKTQEYGTFSVQKCDGTPEAYHDYC